MIPEITTILSDHLHAGYLALAIGIAGLSADPSTQVGAVLVTTRGPVSAWNRFPAGIAATPERLACRATKNRLTVHAEAGAIHSANKHGYPTAGATLYAVCTNRAGDVWGGCCAACALALAAAGVREVVTLPVRAGWAWEASCAEGRAVLVEAGVVYREIIRRPAA